MAHTSTTPEKGTQEPGIKNCLKQLGFKYEVINTTDFSQALETLVTAIDGGASAIMLTQTGQHWVAAIGIIGSKVVMFDSQRTKKNKYENGVMVLGGKQLRKFWNPFEGKYYAIIVRK